MEFWEPRISALTDLLRPRRSARNRSRSSWITWVITETFMSSLFWRAKRRGCSAKRTGQKARRTNSRCWKRSRKPPPFRASYRKREKFTLKPSSRRGEESLKRVPQALRHGRRRRKVWLGMRTRRVGPLESAPLWVGAEQRLFLLALR